jgi:GNAT superfamily N-acetyltransferase
MGAPTTARFFVCLRGDLYEPMVELRNRIHVRQADRFDAAALARLRVAALGEMGLLAPAEAPEFLARARAELWSMLGAERVAAWLLCIDDVVCGCACVVFWERLPYPGTSLHAELAGVYVAPEHRRRGYAAELIAEALATARAHGVRRVVLQPTDHTRALYARFGFGPSGQLRLPP